MADNAGATRRIVWASARAAGVGVRVLLCVVAIALMLAGGLVAHPLGLFVFGVPLAALGVLAMYKGVYG